jgi:DNA-directed RNA polymerase subunit N (RpoN/RPB10)
MKLPVRCTKCGSVCASLYNRQLKRKEFACLEKSCYARFAYSGEEMVEIHVK